MKSVASSVDRSSPDTDQGSQHERRGPRRLSPGTGPCADHRPLHRGHRARNHAKRRIPAHDRADRLHAGCVPEHPHGSPISHLPRSEPLYLLRIHGAVHGARHCMRTAHSVGHPGQATACLHLPVEPLRATYRRCGRDSSSPVTERPALAGYLCSGIDERSQRFSRS